MRNILQNWKNKFKNIFKLLNSKCDHAPLNNNVKSVYVETTNVSSFLSKGDILILMMIMVKS